MSDSDIGCQNHSLPHAGNGVGLVFLRSSHMPGTNYEDEYVGAAKTAGKVVLAAVAVLVLIGVVIGLLVSPGCVAYRDELTGSVGVGIELDKLPETASQFGRLAADLLPPPFNYIAGGIATLVLGGGGAAVAKRSADKARQREREEWDAAQRDAELSHARRDAAFDEGTQRAAPVASVVAPATPVSGLGVAHSAAS